MTQVYEFHSEIQEFKGQVVILGVSMSLCGCGHENLKVRGQNLGIYITKKERNQTDAALTAAKLLKHLDSLAYRLGPKQSRSRT